LCTDGLSSGERTFAGSISENEVIFGERVRSWPGGFVRRFHQNAKLNEAGNRKVEKKSLLVAGFVLSGCLPEVFEGMADEMRSQRRFRQ
jgi:hypothetical protein